jgi:hypothetical protein
MTTFTLVYSAGPLKHSHQLHYLPLTQQQQRMIHGERSY